MDYQLIVENYTPELQFWDALDLIKHYDPDGAKTLDLWVSLSSNEKNGEEPHQKDPILAISSPSTQSPLSGWETHYKFQEDSISIVSMTTMTK